MPLTTQNNELSESGQAGDVSAAISLISLPADESLERAQGFRHEFGDLKERWNNRLVLKGRSLSEAYLNRNCGVIVYGSGEIWAAKNCDWACSIAMDSTIHEGTPIIHSDIKISEAGHSDGRQNQVVLIVIVEAVESPKRFVRAVLRPYIFEKRARCIGEGFLYQRQNRGGYEVLPVGVNGEVFLRSGLDGSADAGCEVIERGPEIMGGVTDNERERVWNGLQRTIMNIQPGFLHVGEHRAVIKGDFIQGGVQGLCAGPNLFDVAVGPFNL